MTDLPPVMPVLPTTTARLDPDIGAWVLAESPMGPGGALALDLAAGVTLSVDAADPLRIVEVVVELDGADPAGAASAQARAVVTALLGEKPADPLAGAAGHGQPARTVFGLAVDPGKLGQRRLVGRLALLDDLRAATPGSGWWAAEAALLCAQADGSLGLSSRSIAESAAAVGAMLELAALLELEAGPAGAPSSPLLARALQAAAVVAARLEESDPSTAGRLRNLGPWLAGADGRPLPPLSDEDVDTRFADLLGTDLSGTDLFGADSVSAELADATRLALRAVERDGAELFEGAFPLGSTLLSNGQLRSGVVAIPGTGYVSWHRGWSERTARVHEGVEWTFQPAEMLVRVPVQPGVEDAELRAVWVRVFDVRTGDLITIVPLGLDTRFPATGIARIAVPRDLPVDDLALEVTNRPTQRPDGRYTVAVRRACVLARAAGTAERLGWWTSARKNWETVAAAWAEIGDTDRRSVALAYAARAAEEGGDPQGAATLLAASRAGNCQWAARLVDAPREIGAPFLAEMFDQYRWTA